MLHIDPPFGYQALKPLNRADYVRWPLPGELPAFVRNSQIIPLSYAEIVPAVWHYPVVFVQDSASKRYAVAALLGLKSGANMFGQHSDGKSSWDAQAYVPAYVRRYPFCMATVKVDGKVDTDLLVCVETSQTSTKSKKGYVRLFDEQGQPVEQWKSIEAFLKQYEASLSASTAFCARLAELDLLQPFTANINPREGEPFSLGGMFSVDETKLAALSDATLGELQRSGYLSRIAIHLMSLQRFHDLLEREVSRPSQGASASKVAARDPGIQKAVAA